MLQEASARRLGCLRHDRSLCARFACGDDLSAPAECACRAAELADADGQLRQLEQLGTEPDQREQRRQSQGQIHGLARRPRSPEQGQPIFYAARRRRLSCMWATSSSNTGSSTFETKSRNWCGNTTPRCKAAGQSLHSVALLGNNIYINTGREAPNPRLIALDKNSGEVVFDVSTAISGSARFRALRGTARGQGQDPGRLDRTNESGRGYVAAYAADTGKFCGVSRSFRNRASRGRRHGPTRAA